MSDIFREVDEEVRRDQAVQLWRKYQNYVIAAALIVVAATGAWKGFAAYKMHQAEEADIVNRAFVREHAGEASSAAVR